MSRSDGRRAISAAPAWPRSCRYTARVILARGRLGRELYRGDSFSAAGARARSFLESRVANGGWSVTIFNNPLPDVILQPPSIAIVDVRTVGRSIQQLIRDDVHAEPDGYHASCYVSPAEPTGSIGCLRCLELGQPEPGRQVFQRASLTQAVA